MYIPDTACKARRLNHMGNHFLSHYSANTDYEMDRVSCLGPIWNHSGAKRPSCWMYKEVHWLYGFPRVLCFLMRLIIFLTCEEIPPLSWTPFRNLEGAVLERDQWQWILSWGHNSFSDEDRESSTHCFETIRNKFRVLVTFLQAVAKGHDLRVPST